MTKRKPGRPEGSPNRQYEVVPATPTRCRKCQQTDFIGRKVNRTRQISGIAPDGKPYNRIRWVRCQCRNCLQWLSIIEYELEVVANKEG